MTKEDFEARARLLEGRRLVTVRYYELDYKTGRPEWCEDPRFDSLDFGLDLEMDDQTVFGIVWGNDFEPHGLSVVVGSLATELLAPNVFNVTGASRWAPLIGQRISECQVKWSYVRDLPVGSHRDYPQDLVLSLGPAKVYLSALEIRSGDSFVGMADHVTVFFEKDVALRFGVEATGPGR